MAHTAFLGYLSTVGTAGVIDESQVVDGGNEGNGGAKIDSNCSM